MADVGVLLVGPDACSRRIPDDLPVARVRAEPIAPLPADMLELAREAGPACSTGADADRWLLLPAGELSERSGMLWASSQVGSADPVRLTDGWQAILVVAWIDELALPAVLRALGADRPVTVLLGGRARPDDGGARRNHVVLCELLRRQSIAAVLHAAEPDRVLDVALDTARTPTVADYARRKAVDLGPMLGLPSAWAIPAPAVPIPRLIHVPLGHAGELPRLVAELAAYEALRAGLGGPPGDVGSRPGVDLDELRRRLPTADPFEDIRTRVLNALGTVEFVGEEPLVDAIARALRPVAARVRETAATCAEITAGRLVSLRAFGAAGIEYTVQRLRAQLDASAELRVRTGDAALDALLDGDAEPDADGVSALAWRAAFAGVPCFVVRRGQPGWSVARQLVKDRFSQFKGEFATAVAAAVEERVSRAIDPTSPLPAHEVRALFDRAVRVRDALRAVQLELNGRVLAGCELAVRQDALVRWVTPDANGLRAELESQLHRHGVTREIERALGLAFSRRPLGLASAAEFGAWLDELVQTTRALPTSAQAAPTYASVLGAMLQDRDPTGLRAHLLAGGGTDPVLFLQRNTPADLMEWFQRTGMRVEIRPGEPRAIAWATGGDLTAPAADARRDGTTEHRLADLLLSPPEGDTAHALAATAEAAALVALGLIVGELRVEGDEGVRALVLHGDGLGAGAFLPHGGVHALAVDAELRAALRARVARRVDGISAAPDAAEALLKLVELAELGPSPRVTAQLGLDHPRYKQLLGPIREIWARAFRAAAASVLEHALAAELRALIAPPGRHAVVDLLQLAPLGAP